MATFPYNWTPETHQMPVIKNRARFKVLVWHRKAHKTTFALNELFRWANAIRGTYWYVAPYLSQAKKIVWQEPEMAAKYCHPDIWEKRNNSELYITFPNGSVVYIMGADNPDSLRGPNPRGVVLDEYDDMKPEIWSQIIQPIMTANPNGWTWFIGTPKGQRDLFKKYQYATNAMAEKGVKSDWYASRLKASESGIIPLEGLMEAKKTTTEDFFKQEYEVEFLEGAGTFFKGIEACIWPGKGEAALVTRDKRYKLGIDWAKVNDYTVITPFDLTTFTVLRQERFNQIDYNLQKARAEAAYYRFNKARVTMDSTGVGEPIFDDLSTRVPKLEPFHFTENSRRDLLTNLQMLIEQRKIKIPDDEILLNELKSFQYNLTERGKIRIACPDNQHDDTVMSLALAVWDIPKEPIDPTYDQKKEDMRQFDFYKDKPRRFERLWKRK